MEQDWMLAKAGQATRALQECASAPEAKKLVDLGHAAEVYAKRQRLGNESIKAAHAFKVDSQRLLGMFLATSPKATGAKGIGPVAEFMENRNGNAATLEQIGLTKRESSESQFLHNLAINEPEKFASIRNDERTVFEVRQELNSAKESQPEEAHCDVLNPENHTAWDNGSRANYEDFDYAELDRRLAAAATEYEPEVISPVGELFSKIMEWVWSGKTMPSKVKLAMIRFCAFSAGLRPDLVDNASYEKIGKMLGASKQTMSEAALSFQELFGVKFSRSRKDESRNNMSRAMLGHPQTRFSDKPKSNGKAD